MSKQILMVLISFLLFIQSLLFGQSNQPSDYDEAAAYEAFSAILSSPGITHLSKSKSLVIRLETKSDGLQMCIHPDEDSQKIVGTAIADYLKINKTQWLLQKKFKLEMPYNLISLELINNIFKNGGWGEFYKQYPDSRGFVELSAVGFNAEKTVAVVYMGQRCGMLCGEGEYFILQKKDQKWSLLPWKGERCSWVS